MRSAVYAARIERALDDDVRWPPNEYAPDGFVERVCPLERTNGTHDLADCPSCDSSLALARRSRARAARESP
jgi:hypothetical protein